MDALSLIIGIGIVCFLLLYFVFNIKEEHFLLQILGVFFFIFLLFLIPKAMLDFNNNCQLVLNYTKEIYQYGNNFTGYHWDYSYETVAPQIENSAYLFHKNTTNYYTWHCEENPKQTSKIFYNIVVWFARLFVLYVFLYIVFYSFKWFNGIVTGKKEK